MKCTLMNKNTKVLNFELDENNNIVNVYDIYDIKYAPLIVYGATVNPAKSLIKELNKWFKGRGIPSWRKELESLLEKLNVSSKEELLNKAYGLSLSDQYWFKDFESESVKWDDINFFTNSFEYEAYLNASLSVGESSNISLKSPNNTTDGMIQKAWVIENNKRVLIKGTYSSLRTEPINEWLASEIARRLGFDYTDYKIDIYKNKLVSKCECFINENEELISAYQIFEAFKKNNNETDFGFYIRILKEHGIIDAEGKVKQMFLVDYLIGNFDRHLNNFGIIRNVNTLKWEKVAPIYDSGESMYANINNYYDINDVVKIKYFNDSNMNINELIKIFDFSKYDFSKLTDLPNLYKEILNKYKDYIFINDEIIDRIVNLFALRID